MTELDIERIKVGLRAGRTVEDLADEAGVSTRTLLRQFAASTGLSLRAWRTAEGITLAEGRSTAVFFRLPEYDALVDVADEDELAPNEWARNAVQAALRRREKKKKR
ncbi:MAG: hypothetical protein JNL82_29930 [Myxococcales bacterium]|nr:hypothetical protein [Myxococcales bacterium]